MKPVITKYEYDFMTGQWEGVKMAGYNAVYEFCKEFGWVSGLDYSGNPVITSEGLEAMKAYQINDNNLRIDVI